MALQRLADASHRVVSYSPVKQRSPLRSRRALLRPGSLSSLSLLSVGWVERQRHPSPALAGPGSMASRTALNPSYEFVSFVPSFRGHLQPGISFLSLPSQLPIPRPRGWRSAGRRYPLSCRARNRATPRLRSVGHPAQPERRPAALHRDGFGPAPRSAPELLSGPLARAILCRHASCLQGSANSSRQRFLRAAPGRHLPLRLQAASRKRPSMSGIWGSSTAVVT